MHLTYRKTCRACGSSALERVIDLGEQYIQGAFLKPGETPPLRRIPLVLVRCDPMMDERACGLLQTSCTVPPEILYARYWYRSGTNQTMRDHLCGIVKQVLLMRAQPRLRVLDIGCNDGTLLGFYPDGFERFGIDPSNAIDEVKSTEFTLIKERFPSEELATATKSRPFDVITSIAMFYDLEDPVGFVRSVREVLAPDGLWIFEMSYMPSMLEMNSYDTICHEHLEYYSLAVVEWVVGKAGMKIVRAELNDINGGSIRCYATPTDNYQFRSDEDRAHIGELRKAEFDLALDTENPYRSFQERVNAHRDELTRVVKDYKRAGKRIHVYGASTKGNTILQFCGLDNSLIDFAADRNPDKYGARTIGTDIPIISEEESRRMRPDLYLVLPWHFQKEFLERERNTLAQGTAMIFPLPQIKLITAAGEIAY